jgi:hypothetical protein
MPSEKDSARLLALSFLQGRLCGFYLGGKRKIAMQY